MSVLLKAVVLILWLLLGPLAAWWIAAHRPQVVAEAIRAAEAFEQRKDWDAAQRQYELAQGALRPDDTESQLRLQLRIQSLQAKRGRQVQSLDGFESLLDDVKRTRVSSLTETLIRMEYAKTLYEIAWMLRRQGASPYEWKTVCEQARSQFEAAAALAAARNDVRCVEFRKNAAVACRLAHDDFGELLGRPLPTSSEEQFECLKLFRRRQEERQSALQSPNDDRRGISVPPPSDQGDLGR